MALGNYVSYTLIDLMRGHPVRLQAPACREPIVGRDSGRGQPLTLAFQFVLGLADAHRNNYRATGTRIHEVYSV